MTKMMCIPGLLEQNLHFNEISDGPYVHVSWRNPVVKDALQFINISSDTTGSGSLRVFFLTMNAVNGGIHLLSENF